MRRHRSHKASQSELVSYADGVVSCQGDWTIYTIHQLKHQFSLIDHALVEQLQFAKNITIDTAGAIVINKIIDFYRQRDVSVMIDSLKERYQKLVNLIHTETDKAKVISLTFKMPNVFCRVGSFVVDKIVHLGLFFAFVGELSATIINAWRQSRVFKLDYFLTLIDETGVKALSIVALLAFLIGIVLSYQLGLELKNYGMNIFIVQISGVAILREFGPLITAIIMAGRTSTSFAALIGTMQVNEEIDALKTMNQSPFLVLVVPRIIVLFLVLPLLVVWANLFCVLGSMIMAKTVLGIHYSVFINEFSRTVALRHYVIGMSKVPLFSLIIATVGCFQGLSVGKNAESVGVNTTRAAVQSIFLIIIVDAFYSILINWMGV